MTVEVGHGRIIKFVKSKDGLNIYAEAVGDPSKPHVVFVHGLGLSGIAWDAQFSNSQLIKRIYAVCTD
jgi:pimeloyl-ACP methyl ester carboxylesterase